MLSIDVIIPVYKPGKKFNQLIIKLLNQSVRPNRIILLNTVNGDNSSKELEARLKRLTAKVKFFDKKKVAIDIIPVQKADFDHGATRRKGVEASKADYFVMMTQDAVPCDDYLIEYLLRAVCTERCAVAYARQCASLNDGIVEQYTRLFNYPSKSQVKTKADLPALGIKTFFCSDVCAMYQRSAYDEVGGFPMRTLFAEDSIIASKLIAAGYSVNYEAQARVMHSHNYSATEQFHRNFDLGVAHAQYREIFAGVPSEKEGIRLVKNTMNYLIGQKRYLEVIDLFVSSGAKFLGYQLGKRYRFLPQKLLLSCTTNPQYFTTAITKKK